MLLVDLHVSVTRIYSCVIPVITLLPFIQWKDCMKACCWWCDTAVNYTVNYTVISLCWPELFSLCTCNSEPVACESDRGANACVPHYLHRLNWFCGWTYKRLCGVWTFTLSAHIYIMQYVIQLNRPFTHIMLILNYKLRLELITCTCTVTHNLSIKTFVV